MSRRQLPPQRRQAAQELRARRPYYSQLPRPTAGQPLPVPPPAVTPKPCNPANPPPQLF